MPSPSDRLTPELASLFARTALGHVTREYPNKMDHVLNGPQDIRGQRDLHPIFYGRFVCRSCVHPAPERLKLNLKRAVSRCSSSNDDPSSNRRISCTSSSVSECIYFRPPLSSEST